MEVPQEGDDCVQIPQISGAMEVLFEVSESVDVRLTALEDRMVRVCRPNNEPEAEAEPPRSDLAPLASAIFTVVERGIAQRRRLESLLNRCEL